MTPSPVRSKGARTRDHVRARGPRAAPCRGRGAPAHRSAADVLDRRVGRPRLPGGEAPRSQRRALLTVRVARPGDHGEPRAGSAAQGGNGLRRCDRAHRARSLRVGPTGPPRRARVHRRARARRPDPGRQRDDRGGRGCGARGAHEAAVLGRLGARGGARRDRRRRRASHRGGGRLPPRRGGDRPCVPGVGSALSARPPRPGRRPWTGAGEEGARARRGGVAQPPPRRTARHGQDDAREAAAVHPPAPDARGIPRGDAHPLRRRHARSGLRARPGAPLPGAAPRGISGRDDRRRDGAAAGRGQPRPSRRPSPRRASGVHARGARGAAPATRGRRRLGRSRRRPRALPRTIPTRGDDEPLSLRRTGRSSAPVLVLARQDRRLSREGLARAARPLRSRGCDAAAAGGGACGRPSGVVRGRSDARRRRRVATPFGASAPDRAPHPSFSTAPSTGCPSRAAAGPAWRAWPGRSLRSPGLPTSCRSTSRRRSRTAPRRGSRARDGPRPTPWGRRLPSAARPDPGSSEPSLASGRRAARAPRPSGRRHCRCPRLLRVRAVGRTAPCDGGRGRRRRRGQWHGARRRRRGAPWRARGGRRDRRGARLWHRPRLPGGARRARGRDRRGRRARRVRVRARRGARPVALPRQEPDHRGTRAGDGRRRGARAVRCAHHRRLRAGGRARGARGAGRDHIRPQRRNERVAADRGDSGNELGRTFSKPSVSRRSDLRRRSRTIQSPPRC